MINREKKKNRNKNLSALEKRLKDQERWLAKAKKKEQRIYDDSHFDQLEKGDHDKQQLNELKKHASNMKGHSTKNEETKEVLKKEKKDLDKIVKKRKSEIRRERAKIQKELNKTVSRLYKEAIKMHKSGMHEQARRMFLEVDGLNPNYKKTHYYLTKIDAKLAGRIPAGYEEIPKANAPHKPFVSKNQPVRSSGTNRLDIISDALDSVEKSLQVN